MPVVLAAAAPVAAEPVEQAVQHYPRTGLIAAVVAEAASECAAAMPGAAATVPEQQAVQR